MAKFAGKIGFVMEDIEVRPGVYKSETVERPYFGDVLRNARRWEPGESVNDDLVVKNQFSVVADTFAMENLPAMRYILYMGTAWKISSVELNYPRMTIEIGGVWNGPKARVADPVEPDPGC